PCLTVVGEFRASFFERFQKLAIEAVESLRTIELEPDNGRLLFDEENIRHAFDSAVAFSFFARLDRHAFKYLPGSSLPKISCAKFPQSTSLSRSIPVFTPDSLSR